MCFPNRLWVRTYLFFCILSLWPLILYKSLQTRYTRLGICLEIILSSSVDSGTSSIRKDPRNSEVTLVHKIAAGRDQPVWIRWRGNQQHFALTQTYRMNKVLQHHYSFRQKYNQLQFDIEYSYTNFKFAKHVVLNNFPK